MREDPIFPFTVLQAAGGTSKSLMIPSLSTSYRWTASAVAGKNAKVPIYILAEAELEVEQISDRISSLSMSDVSATFPISPFLGSISLALLDRGIFFVTFPSRVKLVHASLGVQRVPSSRFYHYGGVVKLWNSF